MNCSSTKRQKNEMRFLKLWESETEREGSELGLVREVIGIVPGRKFRYDFQVQGLPVLVEVHGGTYSRGKSGHNSGEGIFRDAVKVNEAQYNGYHIFVFTVDMLKPEYIRQLIRFCEEMGDAE